MKKKPCRRIGLPILLSIIFLISVTELALYGIHAQQNRARQAQLSTQHTQEELQQAQVQEQAQVTATTVAADVTNIPATVIIGSAARADATTSTATVTPTQRAFFQMIGLLQKSIKPFVQQNSDTVGWITIEGIIDQPILYRDNSYYLTHDFDQHQNVCGALFVDVNTPIRSDTQNLVIYGHNMKDGSMFGRLLKYIENDYLRKHYAVKLDTRFESFHYIIFAVDRVSIESGANNFLNFFGYPSFSSENEFDAYIDRVYQLSQYSRFLDVSYSDTLLTLATCIENDRLVLLARRQRENETESDLQRSLLGLYTR